MAIPKTIIAEIRERVDLNELVGRYVRLKARGGAMIGLCPFHQEKSPSFNVNNAQKFYYCFGCQAGGDCYKFLMEMEGLNFAEAVKELGDSVGVKVEDRELTREEKLTIKRKATLHDVNLAAADWFHDQLFISPEAELARKTLKQRGIREETVRRSRLGFAPDSYDAFINAMHKKGFQEELLVRAALAKRKSGNRAYAAFRNRIMFPIFDLKGRPIAFGGRALSDSDPAKYLNSASYELYDKSRELYGLNWAKNAINRKNRILVVEGYFDVLSLHQAGFEEAVASCGTALRSSHLRSVKSLASTAYALFDGDEAGMRAAEKSLDVFLESGLEGRYLTLPDGQDPDDFIQNNGGEAFQAALDQSIPLLEFVIQRTALRHGTGAQGQRNALNELLPLLRRVDGVLQASLILRSSDLLRIPEEAIRKALGRPSPQPQPGVVGQTDAPRPTWKTNVSLNHLFWLLIHHHAAVVPIFQGAHPVFPTIDLSEMFDVESVQSALRRLIDGTPVAEVIGSTDDPFLAKVLAKATATSGLYTYEKAFHAVTQHVAKLHVTAVESKIQHLHLRLSQLDPKGSEFSALFEERFMLQKRLATLNKTSATSSVSAAVKP